MVHLDADFSPNAAAAMYVTLVENAWKFRDSAQNQIPIFRGSPPPVGVSENVWFCMV